MSTIDPLPPVALSYLSVWDQVRGLTIGGSLLPTRLARHGHTVFAMANTKRDAARLKDIPGIIPMQARPEQIPVDPIQFEVVFAHQSFHQFDAVSTLREIARVLRPGGCFSSTYLVRDDSVPWVRRLTALLRHYDPMAMRGNYGQDSMNAVMDCKYFPEIEHRAFRIWQEISLEGLQQMVAAQPLSRRLTETQKTTLEAEVSELFSQSVRPGENLRLPFQLLAWRAWVSHDELTEPVSMPEHGLKIDLPATHSPRYA